MPAIIMFVKKHWLMSLAALAVVAAIVVNVSPAARQSSLVTSSPSYGGTTGVVGRDEGLAYDSNKMGVPSIAPMPPEYGSGGKTAAEVDQKIIKTGSLTLEVDDVDATASDITDAATAAKGFVQESSVSERGDGTHAGNVTVRVPASEFESMMANIKTLANVVKSETVSGQDVTEQYTDLQARLRNAKAQEQVYLEILKQAKTVDDTLKVQYQLGLIRAEIESMQGRIQYLENVTSYSTITVYIEEAPTVRAPTKGFRPLDIVRDAVQTLVNTLQAVAAGLISFIIIAGGLLIPLALIGWLIWTIAKRIKRV